MKQGLFGMILELGIDWKTESPKISEKDMKLPSLREGLG